MKIFLIYLILLLNISNLNSSDWKHIKQLNTGQVEDIGCWDSLNCFCLIQQTGSAELYKSSDGGKNWSMQYKTDYDNPQTKRFLNARQCVSPHPDYFYIPYAEGGLIKSTDGGVNFKTINLSDSSSIWNIVMKDSLIGIARTTKPSNVFFHTTNDGWETSRKLDSNIWATVLMKEILDNDLVPMEIGGGNEERTYFWSKFYDFNFNTFEFTEKCIFYADSGEAYRDNYFDMSLINDSVYYMAGSRSMSGSSYRYDLISKTTDSGKTWEKQLDSLYEPTFGLQCIAFYDAMNGVAVGQRGKLLLTNNGGKTWYYDDLPQQMIDNEPLTMKVTWAGKTPVVGTWYGNIYRYEGNYFKFVPVPNPITLISPKNNTVKLKNEKAEFIWFSAEGYQEFYFQLSDSPDFVSLVRNDTLNKADITVSNLQSYTNYFWRVAFKYNKKVIWSEVNTFRTQLITSKTLSPDCNTIDQPDSTTLQWSEVKGAEKYRIRLSDKITFDTIIFEFENITSTEYKLNKLEYLKKYYWQVQPYRSDESGEWSEVCSFTVEDNPSSVLDDNSFRIIYPNPAGNFITLSESDTKLYTDYEIYDINGRLLQKSVLDSFRIDISALERGSYYLRLFSPSGIATAGFLKME
ncbi:MAG: T9SS type A sorting domain-containing protein [Candidatus Kapabacteria bacterium]|nr:T9SS type A sorting domain-containing protein [Candidatus Kapabacteria bacterium]